MWENDIMIRLDKRSKEKDVYLTSAHKLFFFRLLMYAKENGTLTEKGYSIKLPVDKISVALNTPKRTTIQSLKQLSVVGAIQRITPVTNTPVSRIPTTTIINKEFYEEWRRYNMVNMGLFLNEEKIIINSMASGMAIKDFTREECLKSLRFSRDVSGEQDMIDLLNGIIEKIEGVSDEEWNKMRLTIPFETDIGE